MKSESSIHFLVLLTTITTTKTSQQKMAFFFPLSEDARERINRIVAVSHTVVHYGWVPFVLYVGYTRSSPQPSLIK